MAAQKVVPCSNEDYFPINMSKPLVLQDLSGNIYDVFDWWTAKNVMRHLRAQLPELGDFDIYLTVNDDNSRLFSHGKSPEIKKMLLGMANGPEAMIVFTD